MSRIDDLVTKLCPDGVEFKPLGEIVLILDNLRKPISKEKREPGEIPYYGANGILGYVKDHIFDGTYLLVGEDGSVINKDGSPVVNWAVGKIWVNNHAHVLAEVSEVAILRFIYLYLQTADVTDIVRGTPPKINQANLRSIKIPIPPLEVQAEIVKVLDTFSNHHTALEEELEAELKARRLQYKYYRDSLLTFDERTIGASQGWTTLSEIGKFTRGRRFTNKDFVESGVGCIHYGEIYTHYGLFASGTKSFLRPELAATLRMAKTGDLVVAGTGENVEDIGKAVAWLGDEEVAVHDDCYIFSHSLDPKYLSYFFQSTHFNAQKVQYAAGAKMIRISSEGLGKIRICVPPLEEQERVVSVLDNFDGLVSDLSSNLPAEIQARRQQYEYYRNRLLTFRDKL